MLADASPLGANALLIIGPIVVALALAAWIGMTVYQSRRRIRTQRMRGETAHRGAVQGGVIEGSPSQLNRRDEAPRSGEARPGEPPRS